MNFVLGVTACVFVNVCEHICNKLEKGLLRSSILMILIQVYAVISFCFYAIMI